jgi:DNA-binding transcriptional LysR family regulator
VELRHLRYFVAVAAEGSLTRAAERLHLTQPSLSRQMRQLERDVGTELFERTVSGTGLTAAGSALHRHALLLLRLAGASRDLALSASGQGGEVVQLGIPPGVPDEWLLGILASLETHVPRAAITLTETSSVNQLRMIREGHLDLGLVREPPSGRLRGRRLFDVPFGIAVRPDHPLAANSVCRVHELDKVRVLAHSREQFAQFSEHALACAAAVKAEAAVLIEYSARRLLPGWPWIPLTEPNIQLVTWVAWDSEARTIVEDAVQVIENCGPP